MHHPLRTITHCGVLYIRAEDIAQYIRNLGDTEETDVRNRLNEAGKNVEDLQKLAQLSKGG